MAEATRVALLARPGTACDNLQAALQQVGAEIVHIGDPTAGDAAALSAAAPQAVLVALEPAVEAALDAYDAVLQDPARIVIYDEADLAATREGWDAARWARHLAAKLAGHSDVLPPGRELDVAAVAEMEPEPEPQMQRESALLAAADPEMEPTPLAGATEADATWAEMGLVDFEVPADIQPAPPAPAAEADADATSEATGAAGTRAVTLEYTGPGDGSMLSLVGDDDAPQPAEDAPAEPGQSRVSGAVVVLAGIGGPDAVRLFLGALPEGFPRPVLVRQRLDGGRHDRLVRQLQRATPRPVELAAAGQPLASGHVYIVPDEVATDAGESGHRFIEANGEIGPLAGLPAEDSAILLLSGADPAQVDAVMALAGAGALVAGQSPEECFDNAAPGAAIALGAGSGSPSQLAERVAGRWTA
jgi:chemosensory pili system protein ChpB (putative protein-glutamate methylesterase)